MAVIRPSTVEDVHNKLSRLNTNTSVWEKMNQETLQSCHTPNQERIMRATVKKVGAGIAHVFN